MGALAGILGVRISNQYEASKTHNLRPFLSPLPRLTARLPRRSAKPSALGPLADIYWFPYTDVCCLGSLELDTVALDDEVTDSTGLLGRVSFHW